MKRLFTCIFLFYFSSSLYSQTAIPVKQVFDSVNHADNNTISKIEVEAEYPGGDEGWKNFLIKGLTKITAKALKDKQPPGTYKLFISFIVMTDGTVSVHEVSSTPVNKYLEAKCSEMILQSKNWKPAIENSKLVKAYRKQPVTIVID